MLGGLVYTAESGMNEVFVTFVAFCSERISATSEPVASPESTSK
jgi:hypothetical protein